MHRSFRLFVALILFLAAVPLSVTAQDKPATITGVVTDAGHYVLSGARVTLDPKAPEAVSDQQGLFTISNLAPGDYVVTISYVGLKPYSSTVSLPPGRVTPVEA